MFILGVFVFIFFFRIFGVYEEGIAIGFFVGIVCIYGSLGEFREKVVRSLGF